jgi:hypothetical protein
MMASSSSTMSCPCSWLVAARVVKVQQQRYRLDLFDEFNSTRPRQSYDSTVAITRHSTSPRSSASSPPRMPARLIAPDPSGHCISVNSQHGQLLPLLHGQRSSTSFLSEKGSLGHLNSAVEAQQRAFSVSGSTGSGSTSASNKNEKWRSRIRKQRPKQQTKNHHDDSSQTSVQAIIPTTTTTTRRSSSRNTSRICHRCPSRKTTTEQDEGGCEKKFPLLSNNRKNNKLLGRSREEMEVFSNDNDESKNNNDGFSITESVWHHWTAPSQAASNHPAAKAALQQKKKHDKRIIETQQLCASSKSVITNNIDMNLYAEVDIEDSENICFGESRFITFHRYAFHWYRGYFGCICSIFPQFYATPCTTTM